MKKDLRNQFHLIEPQKNWIVTMETTATLANNKEVHDMTNICFVIAFCEIGKVCYFGIVLLIIMQPPMARNNHKKVLDNLHGAYMISDQESLPSAAFEVKKSLKMTNLLHII